MSDEIFLDSGIFIALGDRRDAFHGRAHALFARPPRAWCTSMLVAAETHNWLLNRIGEGSAGLFIAALNELPNLELLEATRAHHRATVAMLDRLRGHKLTYVDASSLVFIEQRRIREVWGVDPDLALSGARVVPRGE